MNRIGMIVPILLAGCASMPKSAETVYVPTYVSCVGDRPVPPEKYMPRNNSVSEHVRALLIDRERMAVYVAQLEAVITGCE